MIYNNRTLPRSKTRVLPKMVESPLLSIAKTDCLAMEATHKNMYSNYAYEPPVINMPYTGEKTYGEMGAATNYSPEYNILATRSWQAYLESDIARTAINNFVLWSIGPGLTLQAQPNKLVLESEGINLTDDQLKKFKLLTDARFKIHANSEYSSYNREDSLQTLAIEVKKHAVISGDCLVILRYNKKTGVSAEMKDGRHVSTPPLSDSFHKEAEKRGTKIVHGVEINKKRTHIAYYVKSSDNKWQRVPARSRTLNKRTAYLVYGNKYRVDYVRGLPLLSTVLETIKKLDRYKEALVGSAEEVAKVAYQITHGATSTGQNPFINQIANAKANGFVSVPETETGANSCEKTATKVAASTGKMVFNMPVDSEIKALEHKNELYFKEFWETNFNIICGALGIPPEVALSKFENNFSSSRMAGKVWEFANKVDRQAYSRGYYKPFYELWLETEIFGNKIQAPGYLSSWTGGNIMALSAYTYSRFVGAAIPNVDPVKEAKAARIRLGNEHTPLSSFAQEAEELNLGDWSENTLAYESEMEHAGDLNKPESLTSNI